VISKKLKILMAKRWGLRKAGLLWKENSRMGGGGCWGGGWVGGVGGGVVFGGGFVERGVVVWEGGGEKLGFPPEITSLKKEKLRGDLRSHAVLAKTLSGKQWNDRGVQRQREVF